jgi:hypothetical protein
MSSPVIEGMLEEMIELTRRWGRRGMHLLNNFKEKTGNFFYCIWPTHAQHMPTIICWHILCIYWINIAKFFELHGTYIKNGYWDLKKEGDIFRTRIGSGCGTLVRETTERMIFQRYTRSRGMIWGYTYIESSMCVCHNMCNLWHFSNSRRNWKQSVLFIVR